MEPGEYTRAHRSSWSFASHEAIVSTALLGLAVLALVAHLHTEAGLRGVDGYTQAIELQARQRLHVGRLSREALQAVQATSDSEATRLRGDLARTLATIESVQSSLTDGASDRGIPASVRAAVRDVYATLDRSVPHALATHATDVQRFAASGSGATVDRDIEHLLQAESALIELLSAATDGLKAEQENRLRRVKSWNLGYLAVSILTLFGLAFLVLRPIYARIRAEHAALAEDRSELQRLSAQRAQELEASEQKLRAIMDTSMDGICTLDAHGNIMSFNNAAEQMFGLTADEAVGTTLATLLPERSRQRDGAGLRAAMRANSEGRYELVAERSDGEAFGLEIAFREQSGARKRLFTAILRDLTERRRIEIMKKEFISMVSHELRTPLTSIRGSLGLLAGGAMGAMEPKIADLVEIAANNSERLVRLINDILDIEKIEAGRMVFDRRAVDIVACVEQSVQANQAYSARTGVRLLVGESPAHVHVEADADRLRQVLDNLVSNALKHSPSGGVVQIDVALRVGTVRVTVTDRGSGIPVEFQARIFEKFSQADASSSRHNGGTGLGLSISKAIVERLGGTIGFETDPASGTQFFFDLPVIPVIERPAQPVAVRGAPVLVVEDDADVARLLVVMLNRDGIDAEIAANAEQARAMLDRHDYRAMTLDLMLPGQDGITLLRDLRRDEQTSELPVVVVSAVADTVHARLNGSAVGVVDWLSKPIDEQRLQTAVRHALRHSHGNMPRVLHVEDDRDISRTVAAMLEGQAEVDSADSLRAGRKQLSSAEYDLVILDIGLPDGSGMELLPDINCHEEPPPVIVFSAREVDLEVTQLVSAALVKSRTSNDELIEQIRRALPPKATVIDDHV